MSDIKRYQPYADNVMGQWFAAAKEDQAGGWVRYVDHAAELTRLCAEVERLRADLISATQLKETWRKVAEDVGKQFDDEISRLRRIEEAAKECVRDIQGTPDLVGDVCGCVGASDDCKDPPTCGWCKLLDALTPQQPAPGGGGG